MLIGEDPTRIEHLRQKLYRQSFWRLGVIGMSAISGVPDYKLRHPFQQETIHATTLRAAAGAVLDC